MFKHGSIALTKNAVQTFSRGLFRCWLAYYIGFVRCIENNTPLERTWVVLDFARLFHVTHSIAPFHRARFLCYFLSTFSTSGHLSVQSMLYSRYSDPNRAILTHIKIALHTYAITPLVRERTPLSAPYQPIFLFLARTHTSRT